MTTSFTIMTWNLENFSKPANTADADTKMVYEQKLSNLADTIRHIAPDVLAVQEVGDEAAFTDLANKLGGLYPYGELAKHFDPDHAIRVGFISKLELTDVDELIAFPDGSLKNVTDGKGHYLSEMGRGALKATITLESGLKINLITAHLKSKLISYGNDGKRHYALNEAERARGTGLAMLRRTAEAVALRVYTNQLVANNNTPLILLGDMNDTPEAVTTQILEGPEYTDSPQPQARINDKRLFNVVRKIAPDRRYSRIYHKQLEMIDHIMVSYELFFRAQLVDSFHGPIESIGDDPNTRSKKTFPDHAPVYARFEL